MQDIPKESQTMRHTLSRDPRVLVLAALAAVVMASTSAFAEKPSATVTVEADKIGAPIPASLYGIFFEEINHAGDGGLYAELIQNRSFDETLPIEGCTLKLGKCIAPSSPCYSSGKTKNWSASWQFSSPHPAWTFEKSDTAIASTSIQSADPLHANNPTYLRLSVERMPEGGQVRLTNGGYWGIAVQSGKSYPLSLFARPQKKMRLRAGLVDPAGKLLASQEMAIETGGWKRYACSLDCSGTEAKAQFFLQPLGPGRVDLDFVSLLPRETFKNRPNGCRADVAQLLAEMKPAFMRFPGGCVVEGATMANRYQWKKTIGPVHTRPGHWSLWGYRNTDGMGYHEFLQLCEDIGARGLFVVNCGLSCEYRNGDFWPDDKIPELIQDTLDAIEYALGPADSRWGRLRAEAGHAAPLPLAYVEIGNENHGPRYLELYRRFAAAIKKAWPQITLICNVQLEGTEMEDPHFYVAPPFFYENFRRFDAAPRKLPSGGDAPRVYVGEFAVNQEVGRGNLSAALAEAVFMMGMERNGDLVTMCSYAPLLFNVNRLDWPVNMIGYDSATSFGRSSYYAQKMFATHQPDVNLACQSTSPPQVFTPRPGRIGVGTWQTQAEFKDVKVIDPSGKTLLASDFASGMSGFKPAGGTWSVVEGALRQTSAETPARALAGDNRWRQYTLTLKARKLSGAEGFLILVASDARGKSWWNLGGWGNREHGLEIPGVDAPRVPGRIETNRWYDIRVELSGERIRCFLDGNLIHDVPRTSALASLYALAGRKNDSGEIILKVVNAASQPQATWITLKAVGSIAPQARLITLADPDATAENSVESPMRIVPKESTMDAVKPEFSHEFPAHSITIMRFQTRKK